MTRPLIPTKSGVQLGSVNLVTVVSALRGVRRGQTDDGDRPAARRPRRSAAAAEQGRDQAGVLGEDHQHVGRRARIGGQEVARDVVAAALNEGATTRVRRVHEGRELGAEAVVVDRIRDP